MSIEHKRRTLLSSASSAIRPPTKQPPDSALPDSEKLETRHSMPVTLNQVLGLQRLIGNRAVHRLLAKRQPPPQMTVARKDVIQRDVGFEFEVPGYEVKQLNHNMTPSEFTGETAINGADLGRGLLRKGQALAKGVGFELQVDESHNGFNLEFVTTGTGFPENKAGRSDLKATMEDMESLGHEINALRATGGSYQPVGGIGQRLRLVQTGEVRGGIPTKPETVISAWGPMEAEPQTTAGIRLDQIPALIENMVASPGETAQEINERAPVRGVLAGKANNADMTTLSAAAPAARTAIDNFKGNMTAQGVALPHGFGSESLVGLMTLIYTYLKKAETKVNDYPKSLFPLLGISSFAAMFAALPPDDQQPFTADPARFTAINLNAAGMDGTGDTPFFAGGFGAHLTNMTDEESQETAEVLGNISRDAWLQNIPQGTDILTKAVTDMDALESMGKFNRTEQVGKNRGLFGDTRTDAPILELRRLGGHVGINNWKDLALDVYDFIVKLNRQKTGRFKSRRYDPNNAL